MEKELFFFQRVEASKINALKIICFICLYVNIHIQKDLILFTAKNSYQSSWFDIAAIFFGGGEK